ncbi:MULTISPECIES: extracellular solute-binding protein [unclassified Gordonia (in: high G+C Gram-positive bacteria)]|uniref:extracellular solute-binding protein n=1 Tax=unclassified Gordonia (in: high G+C Gram-positive bacteria) TaxID=2657482 RepID=UPI001F0D0863|nr:extracellular solute-binding protein [Gordonia sp. ABSL49_1]MCH5643664.1 extracellular solute-binding protein [Gordonia sp. ABSL49_1]
MGTKRIGRKATVAVAALAAALPIISACGDSYSPGVINFYSPADGASTFAKIGDRCSSESGGEYKVVTTVLPKNADDQRLQLARRLAGNDKGLDLMSMDVVWTAEFADAGWVVAVPDQVAAEVTARTLGGPLETATWRKKDEDRERLFAIPMSTNTQLLWYRKDVLKTIGARGPAKNWEGMLVDAQKSLADGGPSYIMVQGKQYEGLMVWFNSVLVSAGGQVVDPENPDKVTLVDTPEHRAATVRALQIMKSIATAPGADPSLTNSDEGSSRTGMEKGQAIYQVNWPFVFSGMATNAAAGSVDFLPDVKKYADLFDADGPKEDTTDEQLAPVNAEVRKVFDFAQYPGVGDRPSRTTLGGFNIAVASTSAQQDLAFKAAQCITSAESQRQFALEAGPPPVIGALYSDPEFRAAYPMADDVKEQLEANRAAVRPKSPVYQSISTLVTAKLSPVGQWDPETMADELADAVQKAINGEGLIP